MNTDPEAEADWLSEQMREHIKRTNNYQTELLFDALLNLRTEKRYVHIADTLLATREKLGNDIDSNTFVYWNKFLRYLHWKLTGHDF